MAMTLRLSPDDERTLADLAALQGISRQEATIRAIHEAARRHGHERAVSDASQAARARYGDLLKRLGE
ncbi:CopG family transcriptional regulator [Parenemella sanctibonifatiensis]|uniref:CopG family transcriptional regulator n=1 Tax=Parenemella sanctibonifatiensis TaxID=2016505 RepID=A0A255E4Y2_9ACTN|nr:CopG family transcriptional regulator [Parenemella sanctibonifatiensis]OYN86350.1 CopG family transcriptional regulator [Parenemella sanctibonifatiensis]